MDKQHIGQNVRRLRMEKGWTQSILHEETRLSIPAIGNIERGKAEPRIANIKKIADALDVNMYELLREAPSLESVRFRANNKMKRRDNILVDVADWLNNYNLLESFAGEKTQSCIPKIISKLGKQPSSKEEIILAANLTREFVGLENDEKIYDVCNLVESKGIKVYERKLNSSEFFGLSVGEKDGGPAIVVNTNDRISVERWIFTVAHELGHLILHQSAYDSAVESENDNEELEANIFASHFLVPKEAFQKVWEDYYGMPFVNRVLRVKRIFNVSYKTILYRINEELDGKRNIWVMFYAGYKRQFGRSISKHAEPSGIQRKNFRSYEPESKISEEPENLDKGEFGDGQYLSLIRKAIESENISVSKAAKMLKLSITEFNQMAACWI
ncbi:MAG: XRE family transcriptional regulator [Candidatus Marinimicrobia bacterium]|nr:XRE family transcriptional regulator [Candidatus Neomarinimicrobiota bacterium]